MSLNENNKNKTLLLIEPFYSGSHKQLVDILKDHVNQLSIQHSSCLVTLPGKKWHWRARTSALYMSQTIPKNESYTVLLCSSVLNLAELVALRNDLSTLLKVIYFHENQLVYPIQKQKERDFQYGYNQILSAMVADIVVFNSYYNLNSFLDNIQRHLKMQPDCQVGDLQNLIKPKCKVIYFPVETPVLSKKVQQTDKLHIIWPHRWEHDKNPELFFETLFKLQKNKYSFFVSVLGEHFEDVPDIFGKARAVLSDCILQWGRVESKSEYYNYLQTGHVVVSTAVHEFFGVAMLEAISCGCFPLAGNCLVYPEFYPSICLYNTPNQLFKKLKNLCERPYLSQVYMKQANINVNKFSCKKVLRQFEQVLHLGSEDAHKWIAKTPT